MKILIDIGHAAHVHLFKNSIKSFQNQGHQVFVVSRGKPYVKDLLAHYGIDNFCLSEPGNGIFGLFLEWLKRTYLIIRLHLRIKFDVAVGTSVSIPYLTLFFGVRSINVQEDDDNVIPLHVWLGYPFSSLIFNPECLQYRRFSKKRRLHSSMHELAYLNSDDFTRSSSVVRRYGLKPYNYILIRKVALSAHHDVGESGLTSEHISVVHRCFEGMPILSSDELKKSEVKAHDMHQVLAHARLVVTDSQTMTAEAACLGIPVIRVSSFKGRLSYLDKLDKLGFSYSFYPRDLSLFSDLVRKISAEEFSEDKAESNRKSILNSFSDFNSSLMRIIKEGL